MGQINTQEYAKYLLGLMDEEADGEEIEDVAFYGYFQMYMPSGKGVEATFLPLENAAEYLRRITPIYDMLDPDDFSGDTVPGYFNGKTVHVAEDVLKNYGDHLIRGLKYLLKEHADLDGTEEAASYLDGIEEVVVLAPREIEEHRSHDRYDPIVYEALSDLVSEHTDYDDPVQILNEAYYSINCDYWISYYLQWHRYGLEGDPLAPYFELYRLGYSAVFSGQKLFIGS